MASTDGGLAGAARPGLRQTGCGKWAAANGLRQMGSPALVTTTTRPALIRPGFPAGVLPSDAGKTAVGTRQSDKSPHLLAPDRASKVHISTLAPRR
jgi:hypothetical protein